MSNRNKLLHIKRKSVIISGLNSYKDQEQIFDPQNICGWTTCNTALETALKGGPGVGGL